ncbi:hypothetical protein LSH36_271g07011 [Paralvinella palmiformis]|uniref:C-type lectin domain-containing protein n=1 Tax=Paralvinella palmiformis TaxID=53620 RepID=A0AAD9N239_9ANNE|nr:hypothetical protein LSH36_271g07011 [Paralvinella palmiformis]
MVQNYLRIRLVLTTFSLITSFHGIFRIVKRTGFKKRAFWIMTYLFTLVAVIYNITAVFSDYLSYPVDVTVKINDNPSQQFPAVTVCNVNPIRKSAWTAFKNRRQKRHTSHPGNTGIHPLSKVDRAKRNIPQSKRTPLGINLTGEDELLKRQRRSILGCTSGWTEYSGSCYKLFSDEQTFNEARDHCHSEGGYLVTIGDSNEEDFVHSLRGEHPERIWLGMQRTWFWYHTDKTPSQYGYSNWADSQPKTDGNCAVVGSGGKCNNNKHFIGLSANLEWDDNVTGWNYENWDDAGRSNSDKCFVMESDDKKWKEQTCSSTETYICEKMVSEQLSVEVQETTITETSSSSSTDTTQLSLSTTVTSMHINKYQDATTVSGTSTEIETSPTTGNDPDASTRVQTMVEVTSAVTFITPKSSAAYLQTSASTGSVVSHPATQIPQTHSTVESEGFPSSKASPITTEVELHSTLPVSSNKSTVESRNCPTSETSTSTKSEQTTETTPKQREPVTTETLITTSVQLWTAVYSSTSTTTAVYRPTSTMDISKENSTSSKAALCDDITTWKKIKCTIVEDERSVDDRRQLATSSIQTESKITNFDNTSIRPTAETEIDHSTGENNSFRQTDNSLYSIIEEYATLSLSEQLSLGHQKDEFIIDCQYAGASCYHE